MKINERCEELREESHANIQREEDPETADTVKPDRGALWGMGSHWQPPSWERLSNKEISKIVKSIQEAVCRVKAGSKLPASPIFTEQPNQSNLDFPYKYRLFRSKKSPLLHEASKGD